MDEIKAIQRAILGNLDYYKGVKLPKAQTHGTLTQRRTHALLRAKRVYDKIK